MSPDAVIQLGIGGMLILALVLSYRRAWVIGWTYDAKVKECDDLRQEMRAREERLIAEWREREAKMERDFEDRLEYERLEREKWQNLAFDAIQTTGDAVSMADRKIK